MIFYRKAVNVLNTTTSALKMFDRLTKRFDQVAKAMSRLSKLKLTGQLTELKVPDEFLKLKMSGELTKLEVPKTLAKLNVICYLIVPFVPELLTSGVIFVLIQFIISGQPPWFGQFGGEKQQEIYTRKIVHGVVETQLLMEPKPKDLISKVLVSLKKALGKLKPKNIFSSLSTKFSDFGGKLRESWKKNSTNKLKFPEFKDMDSVKKVLSSTMGAGMKQQKTKEAFVARAGNAQLGGAIYDQVAKQALQYGQNPDDALSSALSFTNTTMDPSKLTELNKLAMRLAQMNPEKGLEGATSSMMDLFKGESSSMVSDFGMGESFVEASAALKAGKAGDINGFIKGMDELLNKRNMTEQAFEGMMKSPAAQWDKAVNNFKYNLGLVGQMGLEAFGPLITMITDAFDSGKFTPFFTLFGKGLYAVVSLVTWLAKGFMGIVDFLSANIPFLIGLIAGGLVVALWMMLPPLFAMLPLLKEQVIKWFLINWPILLIIAVIFAVIAAIVYFGETVGQVVGFIVGTLFVLGAVIWNTFIGIINAVIQNLWTHFVEPWINIVEWVLNVFNGGFNSFGDAVKNLLGQIISWFLSLGTIVTKIIDAIFGTNWTEGLNSLKDKVLGWGKNEQAITIDRGAPMINSRIEYGNAWDTGFGMGSSAVSKLKDGLTGRGDKFGGVLGGKEDWNGKNSFDSTLLDRGIDKIGKVNEVGSINDTVEVSGEDLATMRELAEMKNIQNFVQMTPSVNVQTGDIRQESDINTIVARIEQVLTEQIVSSAQGVYGT